MKVLSCWLLLALLGMTRALGAEPLVRLEGCVAVKASWADGDSFPVRAADGREFTVRLYGADCLEWHVGDETDARRLREQRQYFGIAASGGSVEASVELAKSFGKLAGQRVAELLSRPFTVHTAFTSALGDGRHERVYGFVALADGKDLASLLVGEGLARAFGVQRETPFGQSQDEYRAGLRDLEMQAAKLGRGVWKHTDWERLPAERRSQRADDAELSVATGKGRGKAAGVLDPNTAARDELTRLPGIGEAMANRLIEGRPYRVAEDLLRVPGMGAKTLGKIRPYLRFSAGSSGAPASR
jgi:competence protein ComEA